MISMTAQCYRHVVTSSDDGIVSRRGGPVLRRHEFATGRIATGLDKLSVGADDSVTQAVVTAVGEPKMLEWLGPAMLERLWRLTLTEVGLLLIVCAICIYGGRLLGELRKANATLRALRNLEDRQLARTERALLSTDLDHRGEPLAHDAPPQELEGVMGPRKSDSRRAFSVKFKRSVVQQIMKGEKSLAEISRELNIQPRIVRQWKRRFDVGTNIPAAATKDVVREAHQAEGLTIPDKLSGVGGQARGV